MITVPVLVLAASVATIFLFFLLSSLSTCNCPTGGVSGAGGGVPVSGGGRDGGVVAVSTTKEDVEWVKVQIIGNGLHMQDNVLRKGINPRTRAQQLQDLLQSVLSLSVYMWMCKCERIPILCDDEE